MDISLIGIGMGSAQNLLMEADKAIKEANIIIGAARMTEAFEAEKTVYNVYRPEDIERVIKESSADNKIAILMSGDVGFYSGAKKLLDRLGGDIKVIPGISSVVYLCAKLHTSWQDVKLMSLHGVHGNIIGQIRKNSKVFALLSGKAQLREILAKCMLYRMENIKVNIGTRLSYDDEKIISGTVSQIIDGEYLLQMDDLAVVLFENPSPEDNSFGCIADEEFIRGEVPMTKSEVRSLSIAKLGLKSDSVIYDIGAGTGSVSIEMAVKATDGRVYAIERNEKAITLIKENKIKFATDNVEIIHGLAPEAIEGLEAPTHVFIGGSAGNMETILEAVWDKNPDATIVVNAIALNTVGEVTEIIKKFKLDADIALVSVAKNREAGSYQLMTGLNPVYIFTLKRKA